MREHEFELTISLTSPLIGCLICTHEESRSLAHDIAAGYIFQRSLSYLTWIKEKVTFDTEVLGKWSTNRTWTVVTAKTSHTVEAYLPNLSEFSHKTMYIKKRKSSPHHEWPQLPDILNAFISRHDPPAIWGRKTPKERKCFYKGYCFLHITQWRHVGSVEPMEDFKISFFFDISRFSSVFINYLK